MRVDEREVGNNPSRIVEGTWLSAELQTWGGPVQQTTEYQVHVFKAGVDPNTPSDGTQPTMPDKEQLRLEALHAAKQCWLQALRAAGLASRARQDAAEAARLKAERDAVAQASRQALLSDLRSAGHALYMRQLQRALRLAVADQDRRAAEARAGAERRSTEAVARHLKREAARRAPCCEEAAEQQRSAQEDKRTEPAAGADIEVTEFHDAVAQAAWSSPWPAEVADTRSQSIDRCDSIASVDRGGEGTRLSA